jgi:hypothetical protein
MQHGGMRFSGTRKNYYTRQRSGSSGGDPYWYGKTPAFMRLANLYQIFNHFSVSFHYVRQDGGCISDITSFSYLVEVAQVPGDNLSVFRKRFKDFTKSKPLFQ